ncbi:MAG: hypothetical protein K5695_05140 [Oscillospiraceae bacterium]|nr:hypothetical protein [Oscillospiraceae bacterium]
MATSRHSYDVYKAEMKRIREKSKQYAYTHDYFRKTALTSFRNILEALRHEYEKGQSPMLSTLLRTHCMIDPELLDYWDFFLYDSLTNATLDLQREIVEKAGKKPHPSFSEKHVPILLNQIAKLNERYLTPPDQAAPQQSVQEEVLTVAQAQLVSLGEQKRKLQDEIEALVENRDEAIELADQRDALLEEIRDLKADREKVAHLKLEKHDLLREIDGLRAEKEIAAAETERQENAELSRSRRQINVLEQERSDLQQEVESLRTQLASAADEKELSRAVRRINVLEQERSDMQQEMEELRVQLASAQEAKPDEKELSRAERRINVLEQERADLQQETEKLRAQLASAQEAKPDEEALSKAQRQVNILELERNELQQTLDEIRKQMASGGKKKSDDKELSRAQRRINVLEQERNDLQEEVKELQIALENAAPQDSEALTEAQKRISELEQKLNDQESLGKSQKDDADKRIAELEQENADLRERKTIEPDEALRIEADAAIEAEKAWLLEELERETGFKYRFDGTSVRNEEVGEMVAGRAAFEQELVNALNATNRSFRDSAGEATAAITAACEELRKTLEQQTNSAINSVVDTSRRLQGTDFRDLLDAFRTLETQVFYKSRSGVDTPEFKEYWKSVRFFLKKLENTLNKLGFLRYMPEVGAELDPETMEALEVDDDYPADPEEYPMYTVKEIVSGGFMDKSGEFPEIKALVVAEYKED